MLNLEQQPLDGSSKSKEDFPWWLLFVLAIGGYLAFRIVSDELYSSIFSIIGKGATVTAFVTVVAFLCASSIGLLLAVASLSNSLLLRQIARFYIEIVRGIPILVLLFYIAFVGAPLFVAFWNTTLTPLGLEPVRVRDISLLWRAIIALTIGYSAFIAEVFRAGILAVDPGQIESAKALGLSRWYCFRFIVFPQAIRTILPPLGNDFIALIKDSSLVSVLGVADITQLGKVYAAGSFRFFETYNIVAYVYLLMTILLSLALRRLERKLNNKYRDT